MSARGPSFDVYRRQILMSKDVPAMKELTGLANCCYVAHQSDIQGKNAPKG